MALAVGRGPGNHLHVARGKEPHVGVLPPGPPEAQLRVNLRWGYAADLRIGGKSDAELYGVVVLAPAPLLGAQALVVGQLQHPIQRLLEVERVVLDAGGRVGWLVERLVEVPAPHLGRVHVQLPGQRVYYALYGVGGLGTPGAAVGVGRGQVGEDARDLARVRVEGVDPRVHEGPKDRDAGGEKLQLSPHVGHEVHLHAKDLTLVRGGQLDVLDLAAPVYGRMVVLRPIFDPLDGDTKLPGQGQCYGLLGVHVQLGAEASAHVGGDNPELLLRYPARQGEYELGYVGDLGRRVQHVLAVLRLPLCDGRPRFDGVGDQPLLDVALLDRDIRLVEGVIDIPVRQAQAVAHVGPEVLVHQRRVLSKGSLHVGHHVQRLGVDLDKLQSVLGLVAVGCDHHGYRVAHEVDLAPRHGPVVRRLHVLGHG